MNQIHNLSKDFAFTIFSCLIRSLYQNWPKWTWLAQSLTNFLGFRLIIDVILNFSTQHSFNLIQYAFVLFVRLNPVLQSLGSGLPSHCLLVFLSRLLTAFFDHGLEVLNSSWNLVTVEENFSYVSYLLNLFCSLFELFSNNNFFESLQKLFCFYFLLLPCTTSVNFTQSLSEVFSFVSLKDLFLKVGPIKFSVRLTINGNN